MVGDAVCGPPCPLPLVCSSSTSSSATEMQAYGDFAVSFFIAPTIESAHATHKSAPSQRWVTSQQHGKK